MGVKGLRIFDNLTCIESQGDLIKGHNTSPVLTTLTFSYTSSQFHFFANEMSCLNCFFTVNQFVIRSSPIFPRL